MVASERKGGAPEDGASELRDPDNYRCEVKAELRRPHDSVLEQVRKRKRASPAALNSKKPKASVRAVFALPHV